MKRTMIAAGVSVAAGICFADPIATVAEFTNAIATASSGSTIELAAGMVFAGHASAAPMAHTVERGVDWRPVEMGDHKCALRHVARIEELDIVPGTALDLSKLRPGGDIDANGRILADGSGRFFFEKAPGRPVRLRGFNCTYGGSFDGFSSASKEDISELADQIVLSGMNLVRLHFFESKFVGLGGLKWWKYRDVFAEGCMPQTKAEIDAIADRDFLDRFHWFVKCLRDRGVYIMFDVVTSPSKMMTRAMQAKVKTRVALLFDERYRRHWKAAFEFWTRTVNPYTNTRFLDDPQILGLTFCNEQDFMTFDKEDTPLLTPAFREKYGEDMPEMSSKLLTGRRPESAKARDFMRGLVKEMTDFYLGVVTNSGFKGFVTHWDMLKTPIGAEVRRDLSAVATHSYHAHPRFKVPLPEGVTNVWHIAPWIKGTCTSTPRGSSLKEGTRTYLANAAMARTLGKPFIVTEYSHASGNECVQEAPVVQSAIAAIQDWQAMCPHSDVVQRWQYDPVPSFDSSLNLMARVASVAMAFGWQRGDIAPAKHAVSLYVPESLLASPMLCAALGIPYTQLAFLTRVGMDAVNPHNPLATLDIVPERQSGPTNSTCAVLSEKLRSSGILQAGNKTDFARGFFVSETGEVTTDLARESMTVDAPRFQAAALKPGETASLSCLSVDGVSTPASILAISLDPTKAVAESSHVLLIVATQFMQEGAVVAVDGDRNLLMDISRTYTQVMRAGRFTFSLATAAKCAPAVHALRMNGTRSFSVPAQLRDGRIAFDLDTSTFEYGTPFFEMVVPQKEAK